MYLGYATIALGSISSFVVAISFGVTLTEGRYTVSHTRNWPLTIGYFIGCLFITASFAAVLLGISKILESLEDMTAAIEEAMDEKSSEESTADDSLDNTWKCPKCGNKNPYYTGTCSCGQPRP